MAMIKTVRTRSARTALVAAPLAAMLLLAGCGSSGGESSPSPSPSPLPTAASTPTAAVHSPSGPQPADPAAAKAEITKVWEAFFSADTPIDERAKYVEDGTQLVQAVNAFATMPQTAQASARVNAITFSDATTADVKYALLLNGNPMLPDASGVAVKTDDGWKVSKNTFCGLLGLTGQPVPGCTS